MTIKIAQEKETNEQLEEAGIETLTYDTAYRQYRLRIESQVNDKQKELLLRMVRDARESRGKVA